MLLTTDALEIAGVPRSKWTMAVQRGLAPWAPPTRQRIARVFDTDSLIALSVAGRLIDQYVEGPIAWQIASEVHRQISADHSITCLSVWRDKGRLIVAAKKPRTAVELHRIDVAETRMMVMNAMRQTLRAKHAQVGK